MANYKIPDYPEFDLEMRELEPTDRAHADLFNQHFLKILSNLRALFQNKFSVMIGANDTEIGNSTLLFVTDEAPPEQKDFKGAAYTNLSFGKDTPTSGENWAQIDETIINGKLAVSEVEPEDAAFFAKIN